MASSDYASESRGAVAIAVMATLSSISLIVVSLRVYARAIMLRNFGVDDACAILACVSVTFNFKKIPLLITTVVDDR